MATIKFTLITTALTLYVGACGKEKSNATSTTAEVAPTSEVGGMVLAAIESAGSVGGAGMAADKAAKASGAVSLQLAESTNCQGEVPINPADTVFASTNDSNPGEVNERAPYYAAAYWYCTMTADGGRTVKSTLKMPVAIACALDDLKFDGTEKDVKGSFTFTTKCFSQRDVDEMNRQGVGSIDFTFSAGPYTGTNSDLYDKELTFTLPGEMFGQSEDIKMQLLYGVTAERVHMAYSSYGSTGLGEASAAVLDFANNSLRFERVELVDWTANGATGDYPRVQHSRILAKGTFDSKGNFTSVTSLEGAATGIWAHATNGVIDSASGNIVTMKGNPKDGIRTHDYNLGIPSLGTVPSVSSKENLDECEWPQGVGGACHAVPERNACFGDNGATCTGNKGIELSTDADLAFFRFPTFAFPASPKYVSPAEFISGVSSRLEFDSVSLSK